MAKLGATCAAILTAATFATTASPVALAQTAQPPLKQCRDGVLYVNGRIAYNKAGEPIYCRIERGAPIADMGAGVEAGAAVETGAGASVGLGAGAGVFSGSIVVPALALGAVVVGAAAVAASPAKKSSP